jgi:hypothetical protein
MSTAILDLAATSEPSDNRRVLLPTLVIPWETVGTALISDNGNILFAVKSYEKAYEKFKLIDQVPTEMLRFLTQEEKDFDDEYEREVLKRRLLEQKEAWKKERDQQA